MTDTRACESPREVGVLLEAPATIGKKKHTTFENRSGAASGQFVLAIHDHITGQWFLVDNMMFSHRISRPLTLLTRWKQFGGAEVALEPTWTLQ